MNIAAILKRRTTAVHQNSLRIIEIVFVFFLLLYQTIGAFPIVPLENDGMRISLGAQSHRIYGDYQYAYERDSQAGTYQLIEFLAETTRTDPFRAFSILTYICSVGFLLLSSIFVMRLTRNRFVFAFICILLFQETVISGYYPNSSMIAAAFLSGALLLGTDKENYLNLALSGITFATAIWIRFDVILMGLCFLPLLWQPGARQIKNYFIFCTSAAIVIIVLFSITGVSVLKIVSSYAGHTGNSLDIKQTLNNYSTIVTFTILFGYSYGLYKLWRNREWRLIVLSTVASLPLVIGYGFAVTSPKYLLYLATIWALPISYGISMIQMNPNTNSHQVMRIMGIALFVGQYIFSPPFELVLGRSTIIYTADEARLRGSIVYSPIYYVRNRYSILTEDAIFQNRLEEYLEKHTRAYLILQDWMTNQWVLYYLQSQGYRIRATENFAPLLEDGQRLILSRGANTIYLVRYRPEQALELPDSLQSEIRTMSAVLYIGPDYTTTEYAQRSFLSETFDWQVLPDWGRFETILFVRNPTE